MRALRRYVALVCAGLVLLLGAATSRAQSASPGAGVPQNRLRFGQVPRPAPLPPSSPAGPARIRLTNEDGAPGPVDLLPKNGGFVGEFIVWNDGPGVLSVSRVALRGDADDPRLPARFSARFADGGGASGVVLPHGSKRITVAWVPDHDTRLRQAIGHVVLTSNDEVAGEVAMGFVATYRDPLHAHLLTWLVFLPFLGAGLVVVLRVAFAVEDEKLRGLVLAVATLQGLLAIVLYQGWSGAVTRVDGNDGFQFIERVVLVRSLGVEYFVGIDGTSVTLVLLTAVLGFVAAIASYGVEGATGRRSLAAYYALLGLVLGSTMGVFVSLDLGLFAAFWVVMGVALVALVAFFDPPRVRVDRVDGSPAPRLAVCAGLSSLFLVLAVAALHVHSDPTFLADGTRASHTFAIPELMRVAYNAKHLTLLGCAWVKVVWGCLFLAFAILIPLAPLHGWLTDVLDRAPAPVAVVAAGVVTNAGVYGLLRVSLAILPDGSRWAAATLMAAGALHVLFFAALALRGERGARGGERLTRLASCAVVGPTGFCLVGIGSMTREGLAGCLVQLFSHGIVSATLILLSRGAGGPAAAEGGEPSSRDKLRIALVGVALLTAAGIPGLSGFWGESLAILGAFPSERTLASIGILGGGGMAIAQLRGLRAMSSGLVATVSARELAELAPLLVLSIALGLHPAPFFATVRGGVTDMNQLVNPVGPDEVALASAGPSP